MQNIVEIKNRIKSVKETSQITKAMELISVSKMRKSNDKYYKNTRYFHEVREVMAGILDHKGDIFHPYFAESCSGKSIYIVISGDTGLAGEYNHRVLSYAEQTLKAVNGEKHIYAIGRIARDRLNGVGFNVESDFVGSAQNPSIEDARRITAAVVNEYEKAGGLNAYLIYTAHGGKKNTAAVMRLLPILKSDFSDVEPKNRYYSELDFEPTPEQVFNLLVPQYILGLTYSCLVQAVMCEHMERMEAMSSATKNAGDMLDELELVYHRARQAQITTELTELTGGASERQTAKKPNQS
ncbi:MAG: ATP synthase F1 subunit gamma [Clostridiales bacterium]|jgi:F-type H+-transporting ATPase subunit gamma|nr:ATP synthase F1 subunit gamma [Clostridiales bacterium]